jgi:ABC-type branched-subunit amino acid transport system substrate-binding protein
LPTLVAVFTAGALIGGLAAVEVVPASKLPVASSQTNGGDPGTTNPGTNVGATPGTTTGNGQSAAPGTNGSAGTPGKPGTTGGPVALPPSKFECAPGKNGGATDRGVTATSINLATTIVGSGIGSSFLGEMKYAMGAVIEQVNRSGGICGRHLALETRDDGWDAQKGAQYLRNYINDKSRFGIPVGASSEGLQVVIKSGDLDRAGFPVVGSDGLAIDQYARSDGSAQPWVWPVATATVSSARIMADEAYKRGARKFGIVFDSNYHFGKEAAAAYNTEVKRLTGSGVQGFNSQNTCTQRYCGIQAGQNNYSGKVTEFYGAKPDYVALFLEPETALTWMQDPNTLSATDRQIPFGYGAAQPLFTYQFETQCGAKCDQMVVWTGFKPNVEKYRNDPAVVAYVRALKAQRPSADEYNQFTESAYVGMQLLVAALRKVGPELTRERLRNVLNAMSYKDGLTLQGLLTFSPTSRFANTTMQAFTMQYKGTPGGWRLGVTERDPHPGVE